MIQNKQIVEAIEHSDLSPEIKQILTHRLKDYENFTKQLDYLHTEVMAGRQFENGE